MGPSANRTGPHWLFFNLSLWTVRRPSLLSPTFHFMSALAGTLTSCSSFFIMFVSGCAVLSGKALVSRKKPSQDQRETQPGVTQTGRERERERESEVWSKRRERDWDREEEIQSQPCVAQRRERGNQGCNRVDTNKTYLPHTIQPSEQQRVISFTWVLPIWPDTL